MMCDSRSQPDPVNRAPDGFPDDIVAELAPIAHAHINMRGVIAFHLDRAAKGLIVPAKAPFVTINR
jgi:hypothetical protein